MKAYLRHGGKAQFILNLDRIWRLMVSLIYQLPTYPRKEALYPSEKRP
jgi:hypothetical protein